MLSNDDKRRAVCAFNSNHVMPVQRYPWHLARCPDHKYRLHQGLPIYRCPHHTLHIFLNEQALRIHLPVCEANQANKENSPTPVLGKRAQTAPDVKESVDEIKRAKLSNDQVVKDAEVLLLQQKNDKIINEAIAKEVLKDAAQPESL